MRSEHLRTNWCAEVFIPPLWSHKMDNERIIEKINAESSVLLLIPDFVETTTNLTMKTVAFVSPSIVLSNVAPIVPIEDSLAAVV